MLWEQCTKSNIARQQLQQEQSFRLSSKDALNDNVLSDVYTVHVVDLGQNKAVSGRNQDTCVCD